MNSDVALFATTIITAYMFVLSLPGSAYISHVSCISINTVGCPSLSDHYLAPAHVHFSLINHLFDCNIHNNGQPFQIGPNGKLLHLFNIKAIELQTPSIVISTVIL